MKKTIETISLQQRIIKNQEFQYQQKIRNAKQFKKTLVVIGKMGHGKSSFIRMLIQDKGKIKCGSEANSITNKCQLYEMSEMTKGMLSIPQKQTIYIIDAPGTNSFQKNGSIIQTITQFIQTQRCEIIGIAYLKNSTDFREDINSSYIQLHKIFPIKKQIKDKISFFVFTNVDKQIFNLKSLQNSKASLKQAYKRQGITFIQSRSFN